MRSKIIKHYNTRISLRYRGDQHKINNIMLHYHEMEINDSGVSFGKIKKTEQTKLKELQKKTKRRIIGYDHRLKTGKRQNERKWRNTRARLSTVCD